MDRQHMRILQLPIKNTQLSLYAQTKDLAVPHTNFLYCEVPVLWSETVVYKTAEQYAVAHKFKILRKKRATMATDQNEEILIKNAYVHLTKPTYSEGCTANEKRVIRKKSFRFLTRASYFIITKRYITNACLCTLWACMHTCYFKI